MLIGVVSWSAGLGPFAAQTSFKMGFIAISGASLPLLTCHVGAYSLICRDRSGDVRPSSATACESQSVHPALGTLMIGRLAELVKPAMGRREKRDYNVGLSSLPSCRPYAFRRDRGDGSRIAEGITQDCAYPCVQ